MTLRHFTRCATAASLALMLSTAYASGDAKSDASTAQPMTGKQKATAIGATTGAVAGAVVGGPVGAVVGAGIGGYVGHKGTDANGNPPTSRSYSTAPGHGAARDEAVRDTQLALNSRGYDAGTVDGLWGPNTKAALRRFQTDRGLAPTGELDDETRTALGVTR
jgi:phage tail tape-measure protein